MENRKLLICNVWSEYRVHGLELDDKFLKMNNEFILKFLLFQWLMTNFAVFISIAGRRRHWVVSSEWYSSGGRSQRHETDESAGKQARRPTGRKIAHNLFWYRLHQHFLPSRHLSRRCHRKGKLSILPQKLQKKSLEIIFQWKTKFFLY